MRRSSRGCTDIAGSSENGSSPYGFTDRAYSGATASDLVVLAGSARSVAHDHVLPRRAGRRQRRLRQLSVRRSSATDRVALIPDPGERWLQAVSSAAEVFPLVAVRSPRAASSAETARLGARLRDRGSTLLVVGPWPSVEASLTVSDPAWGGIGRGHGLLSSRAVTVAASGRSSPRPRRVRVMLPGPSGGAEPLRRDVETAGVRPHLMAVGE